MSTPVSFVIGDTLAKYRRHEIILRCMKCSHVRWLSAESMARLIGWNREVRSMREKFRCSRCQAHRPEIFHRE